MKNIIIDHLRGFEVKLKFTPGIFSKAGVDSGSKLLIEQMKIIDGTMVADLGAGSGVIGIVAAGLNPSGHVHLLDEHLRAIEAAKENIELNNLKNVETYLSDLFSAVGERTYHLILSNPPQHLGNDLLEEAAAECFKHLKPRGEICWVVQKRVKPLIERLFNKYFENFKIVGHGIEHVVLTAKKESNGYKKRLL